jgi:hypothetical protein
MFFSGRTTNRDDTVISSRTLSTCVRAAAFGLLLAGALATGAQSAPRRALVAKSGSHSIAVVGDSLANDLGRGMEDLFRDKRGVKVVKQTRFATGLMRTDYFDWNSKMSQFLRHHNPDAIVVLIGGNDSQSIHVKGRRLDRFSKPWLAEYRRRVAHFMRILKRERAKVYWIGLPAVRSDSLTQNYRVMNKIFQQEAAKHRFKFVSTWRTFLDSDGDYTSFGRSLSGEKRRLRKDDGMHFTHAGTLRLAAHVAKAIGVR